MKIGFIDFETTGLDAQANQLLCGCMGEYKATGNPWSNIKTFRLEGYDTPLGRCNDKALAKELYRELQSYDIKVTWNGKQFDEKFLATRLKAYGIDSQEWKRHKDLLYTAKWKQRLTSNRLENVAEFLKIYQKYGVKKTHLEWAKWRAAFAGHKPYYDYVIRHCQEDIKVLACVWEELKNFVTEIK